MIEPKLVRLSRPVDSGDGKIVSELSLREPCAKDLRGTEIVIGTAPGPPDEEGKPTTVAEFKFKFDLVLTLAARCSGEFSHVIDKLTIMDTFNVMGVIVSFLEIGRQTGGSGSDFLRNAIVSPLKTSTTSPPTT